MHGQHTKRREGREGAVQSANRRSSTPIASIGGATRNGHHHIAEQPVAIVVLASASADPGTRSASPSLLADHARPAARTLSPSHGRSRDCGGHIIHRPDGDCEEVDGVLER